MNQRLAQLIRRFRQQQQFAEEYSPLYAAIFGTAADWLTYVPQDPVVQWLLETTENRTAFETTNLLAAALHYEVLSGGNGVSALAAYYPTVGGDASSQSLYAGSTKESKVISKLFVQALHSAILTRRGSLRIFIQMNTVQTNETGRGISWLLPLCLAHWKGVHLLDLGASAGLNLIADQRAFQFVGTKANSILSKFGLANPVQFVVRTNREINGPLAAYCSPATILSRTGCDLHPFPLESTVDEQVLASFIWADQVERFRRLGEGIAAFQEVQQSATPVRLFTLSLPDDLPEFLNAQQSGQKEPLIIYNTYIKVYLPDKGKKLRTVISEWVVKQSRPIVWIQWEPPSTLSLLNDDVPQFVWLEWTADIWHNDKQQQFQFGWVHPHGHQVQWLPGIESWISYWSKAVNSGDNQRCE